MTNFLFCCGTPRSGTTITQALLDSNPEISMTNEQSFVYIHKKYIHMIQIRKNMEDISMKSSDYHIITNLMNKHLPNVLIDYHSMRKKAKYIGDKLPYYLTYMDWIRAVYPQSKFILVKRRDKDAYESIRKHFKDDMDEKEMNTMLLNHKAHYEFQKDKSDVFVVHYENLREDLIKAAEWLEIEPEFDFSLIRD